MVLGAMSITNDRPSLLYIFKLYIHQIFTTIHALNRNRTRDPNVRLRKKMLNHSSLALSATEPANNKLLYVNKSTLEFLYINVFPELSILKIFINLSY